MNRPWPIGTRKAIHTNDLEAASANGADGAPDFQQTGAMQSGLKSFSKRSCRSLSERKHRFMTQLRGKMESLAAADSRTDATDQVANRAPNQDSRDLHETLAGPIAVDLGTPKESSQQATMTFKYPPGSKPLSQYTIRRGIGVGGFGEVYFALSEAGKEVALKRIQRNLEIELRGVSQCLNLKHPNLVSLFDICRDEEDQAWVVMEFVNGPNLRAVLDQSPDGLSESEVRRWFSAIAAGIHHLHSAGLVHRDIKPANVFDDMGVVKVGDYGLSKFISASHRGGHTESVGTFHYMAPEIGRGEYGRAIDVYAMGVVLHELLTGQVPFDGESCHEIIVKHLTAVPDLSQVPQPFRDVIATALQKDPAKRQSSVEEMTMQLGWSRGQSTASQPANRPIANRPVANRPVANRPIANRPIANNQANSEQSFVSANAAFADFAKPADTEPFNGQPEFTEPVARFNSHAATDQMQPGAALAVEPTKTGEPIARAVRESISDLKRWWGTLDRSPWVKKLLLVGCGLAVLLNTYWLLPVLSLVGIFYVPYYVIRQMMLHTTEQPSYAEAQRIATSVTAPSQPKTKLQWRSEMRKGLRAKPSIHRAAELSTSWIAATFTVIALSIIAGVFGLRSGDVSATTIAPFAWMSVVILLGSMCILGMGKFWEREDGEALPRRLVLTGIGAGVGVVAYIASDFLKLNMPVELGLYGSSSDLPQTLYFSNGAVRPVAVMAHFALLFAALRWWKPVDPLRKTRLSLWSVLVTLVTAWAIHQILPIPQPAGMMIAGGIAIAVQMSAPWIDPNHKRKLRNQSPRSPEGVSV